MEISQQVNKSGGDLPGPAGSCRWGLRCWHNKALRDSPCRAQPCSNPSMCPRDPFAGLSPPALATKGRNITVVAPRSPVGCWWKWGNQQGVVEGDRNAEQLVEPRGRWSNPWTVPAGSHPSLLQESVWPLLSNMDNAGGFQPCGLSGFLSVFLRPHRSSVQISTGQQAPGWRWQHLSACSGQAGRFLQSCSPVWEICNNYPPGDSGSCRKFQPLPFYI